jgi:hypothetical protein
MPDSLDRPSVSRVPPVLSIGENTRFAVVFGDPAGTQKMPLGTVTKAQLDAYLIQVIGGNTNVDIFYDYGYTAGTKEIFPSNGNIQYGLIEADTEFIIATYEYEGQTLELWGRHASPLGPVNVTIGEDTFSLDFSQFFFARLRYMFGQWCKIEFNIGPIINDT